MTHRPDPLEDLRQQFALAAEREIGGRPRRRRRRHLAVALAGLLSVGAVAEAVNLISSGEPVPPSPTPAQRFGVPALGGTVAVTARDPDRPLPFAAVTYRAEGKPCVIAGQLRGNELGELDGETFRSFEGRRGGACGDLRSMEYFVASQTVDGRTLIYGRARPGVTAMEVRDGDELERVETGTGGAYLAVFDGPVSFRDLRLRPLRGP